MEKILDLMSSDLRKKYNGVKSELESFSKEYFNNNFEHLTIEVLDELAKKDPSPILKGRNNGWSAGIVYSLMQANSINTGEVTIKNVGEHFNISEGTIFKRAKEIRELLNIEKNNEKWIVAETENQDIKVKEHIKEVLVEEVKETSKIKVENSKHINYIDRYNSYMSRKIRLVVEQAQVVKIGRNEVCTCGSGKKYKKCCGR